MAKIVFIDPRSWPMAMGSRNLQRKIDTNDAFPNVGIAYLSSRLKEHRHSSLVIDLNNEAITDAQALTIIAEHQPDILAFSVKSAAMGDARNLGRQIRCLFPKSFVVVGGPHATLTWRELIQEDWLDVVFVGEGEHILPLICDHVIAGRHIEDLPGVVTKYNYTDGFSLRPSLISEVGLNNLPFPTYEFFPVSVKAFISNSYPIVTSRGCVYQCVYCSVPKISGSEFRRRFPKNIVDELKMAQEKYGITAFQIIDDLFNFDIKRCKEICHAFIEAKLEMEWSCPNGLRADRIDKELAELMYTSGCRSAKVGVESADPGILAAIKKGETIEDIEKGIRILKAAGIDVCGLFMIGMPGDSFNLQKRAVEFAKKNRISTFFSMFVPYPGTGLWDWAKQNARFLYNIERGFHFTISSMMPKSIIETDDFSAYDRLRAYEMVNTKLKQFNFIIPPNMSRRRYYCRIFWLIWQYDRAKLPIYVLKKIIRKFKRLFRRHSS